MSDAEEGGYEPTDDQNDEEDITPTEEGEYAEEEYAEEEAAEEEQEAGADQEEQQTEEALEVEVPTSPPTLPASPPPAAPAKQAQFVKVLHEYTAQKLEELTLKEGDVLVVVEKDDSGWWKGQLGHETGWFPPEFVAEITEEEVQNFISSSQKGKSRRTKEELQAEMKDLQEELKTQQDASAALKVEIEAIKNDYKKIRKDVKAEFAERQDTLPCAIYKIDPVANFQRDIVKMVDKLGGLLDSERDLNEQGEVVIQQLSVFLPELAQQAKVEEKLKKFQEKVESAGRSLQTYLINQRANADEDGLGATIDQFNVLADITERVANGEPLEAVSPPTSPRFLEPPGSSRKDSDGERRSKSPRKKKRSKTTSDAVEAGQKSQEESAPDAERSHRKDKHRRDKDKSREKEEPQEEEQPTSAEEKDKTPKDKPREKKDKKEKEKHKDKRDKK